MRPRRWATLPSVLGAAALAVLEERAADFEGDREFSSMRAYLLRRAGRDTFEHILDMDTVHGARRTLE